MTLSAKEILGPSGRIAARLKSYEPRPQQLEMAQAVEAAIAKGHHLIVGVGTTQKGRKSFPLACDRCFVRAWP